MSGYTLQWQHIDQYGYETTASTPVPESCGTFADMLAQAGVSATLCGMPVTIVDEEGEEIITVFPRWADRI